jgi:hypothetical protein
VYTINYRPELKLLDIAWHGVFRPDVVADYAQAVWDRFRAEGLKPGEYKLRMDMSESAVQTQEALGVFRDVFKGFPRASRIAIVTPSAIAKLQVRREMTQPYLRLFETAEESLAWLAEDDMTAE